MSAYYSSLFAQRTQRATNNTHDIQIQDPRQESKSSLSQSQSSREATLRSVECCKHSHIFFLFFSSLSSVCSCSVLEAYVTK